MMRYLLRLRALMKPEIRDGLDGPGVVFAVTLFFRLLQAAHDGVVNRNRDFDSQRFSDLPSHPSGKLGHC
jgi:hypothetical protein